MITWSIKNLSYLRNECETYEWNKRKTRTVGDFVICNTRETIPVLQICTTTSSVYWYSVFCSPGTPPNCRPECTINAECASTLACINQRCGDPCANVCGYNAQCSVINHTPVCSCLPGFTGDPFTQCQIVQGMPLTERSFSAPCFLIMYTLPFPYDFIFYLVLCLRAGFRRVKSPQRAM